MASAKLTSEARLPKESPCPRESKVTTRWPASTSGEINAPSWLPRAIPAVHQKNRRAVSHCHVLRCPIPDGIVCSFADRSHVLSRPGRSLRRGSDHRTCASLAVSTGRLPLSQLTRRAARLARFFRARMMRSRFSSSVRTVVLFCVDRALVLIMVLLGFRSGFGRLDGFSNMGCLRCHCPEKSGSHIALKHVGVHGVANCSVHLGENVLRRPRALQLAGLNPIRNQIGQHFTDWAGRYRTRMCWKKDQPPSRSLLSANPASFEKGAQSRIPRGIRMAG